MAPIGTFETSDLCFQELEKFEQGNLGKIDQQIFPQQNRYRTGRSYHKYLISIKLNHTI